MLIFLVLMDVVIALTITKVPKILHHNSYVISNSSLSHTHRNNPQCNFRF